MPNFLYTYVKYMISEHILWITFLNELELIVFIPFTQLANAWTAIGHMEIRPDQ